MFPWKELLLKFARSGIVVRNWPEGVPLPPRPKIKGVAEFEEPRTYQKGTSGIPSNVQDRLVAALRDARSPLHFELWKGGSRGA